MSRLGTERLMNQDSISYRERDFCFCHHIKSASESHSVTCLIEVSILLWTGRPPVHDSVHSSLSSAEATKPWTYIATPSLCRQYICYCHTVCPTRYRTRLAGGPLLRFATIRRTADTHYRHIPLHFSHNKRNPVPISLQCLHLC
jgi:hypothetical protein